MTSCRRILEQAGSLALVEPRFDFPSETAVVFALGFRVPRLWVSQKPPPALFLPLIDSRLGQGITEAESDELHDFTLLPVGERVAMLLDVTVRVEEVGGHRGMIGKSGLPSIRVGRSPTLLRPARPFLPLPSLAPACENGSGRRGGRRCWSPALRSRGFPGFRRLPGIARVAG